MIRLRSPVRHLSGSRSAIAKTRVKSFTINSHAQIPNIALKITSRSHAFAITHILYIDFPYSFRFFFFCIRNDLQKCIEIKSRMQSHTHRSCGFADAEEGDKTKIHAFTFPREFKTFGYNFFFVSKIIIIAADVYDFAWILISILLFSFASVNVISLWILLFVPIRPLGKTKH